MMRYPLLLGSMLERAAKLFPSSEVVSRKPDHSIHRCTYAALLERSLSLACGLQLAGLQVGDRVASLMWNHHAHLEAYFGVPAAGGVLHTVNLRLHPDELTYVINQGGARFLLLDDVLLPVFEAVRDHVNIERAFVVAHYAKEQRDDYEHYDDLISAPPDPDTSITDENTAALMCHSLGTGGHPRPVVYSHRALALHSLALAIPDAFCLSHRDAFMPLQPMFHANAWGFPFVATMLGAKQVLPGPHLDPHDVLDLITREQVTMAGGLPTSWSAILDVMNAEPERWKVPPGCRVMLAGAMPSQSLLRGLDAHGIGAIHAWGTTECSPVAVVNVQKSCLDALDDQQKMALRYKQGLALPFVETRLVDEKGSEIRSAEDAGEFQIRGPWIAGQYYNSSGQSSTWTADGWFRTGDVASIDKEGYVRIVDRAKDAIKSGGEWISSAELESALLAHPSVREAAVIGMPDPKWDERPLAVVALRSGARATPEELTQYLSERFDKWQVPDSFVFLPSLPHTSTGRISKAQLRLRFKGLHWEKEAAAGTGT